jgi:hypothetical protein
MLNSQDISTSEFDNTLPRQLTGEILKIWQKLAVARAAASVTSQERTDNVGKEAKASEAFHTNHKNLFFSYSFRIEQRIPHEGDLLRSKRHRFHFSCKYVFIIFVEKQLSGKQV